MVGVTVRVFVGVLVGDGVLVGVFVGVALIEGLGVKEGEEDGFTAD